MVENTKNTIISILKNNKELKKTDLKILRSISKKFPFFTPSKVLSLVLSKKYKTIDYSKILESAATNVTDRIHLYYILNNDILNDNEKQLIIKDFKDKGVHIDSRVRDRRIHLQVRESTGHPREGSTLGYR